jgi:hypothetical protein
MRSVSYVLPVRLREPPPAEFVAYVNHLASVLEMIVVDASADPLFALFDRECIASVIHVRPDQAFGTMRNGKVRGVLTGLHLARYESLIIADDDVRYSLENIDDVVDALAEADVVRPQNYFAPLPWHARLDTARSLINRITGGDWPGTLAVRRSVLLKAGGYDGDVLFENLELVRTVQSTGGCEVRRDDLFIRRLPPSTRHFWRQRVRQAYDEFARPARMAVAMATLPLATALLWRQHFVLAAVGAIALPTTLAEIGRRRQGGRRIFPWSASFCAPLWTIERSICAWLAIAIRATRGGVSYNGVVVRTAAHSCRDLSKRQADRAGVREYRRQL